MLTERNIKSRISDVHPMYLTREAVGALSGVSRIWTYRTLNVQPVQDSLAFDGQIPLVLVNCAATGKSRTQVSSVLALYQLV